jgi:GDP-L-fucose synthase
VYKTLTKLSILLLGSNKFIGNAIKKILIKEKIKFYSPAMNKIDLKNKSKIERFLSKKKITHLINAEGKSGGILSNVKNQKNFFEDNLEINYNLFKIANKKKIANIINIGSSCMYPKNYNIKMKENLLMTGPLEDTNFGYGLAKLVSSYYLKILGQNKNLNYTTIIPSNLYGPKDNFNSKSSHLIAAIIKKVFAAKKNQLSIEIWGDGKSKREFLYVDDFAEFITKLIKSNSKYPNFLNVGYGKDFTVEQYYKKIINLINPKLKINYNKKFPSGMKRKLLDSSLAKKKFNWKPKTTLNQGLINTIAYYKNYKK